MPEPFEVAIPDETLEDLRGRLERARFSADFANDDWRYGTEGGYLRELVEYWVDAPMEEPELFVENVRQFFRPLRGGADG